MAEVRNPSPLGPQHIGPKHEEMSPSLSLDPHPLVQTKGVLFPRGPSVAKGLTAQQMTSEREAFDEGRELKDAEECHHLTQVTELSPGCREPTPSRCPHVGTRRPSPQRKFHPLPTATYILHYVWPLMETLL